MWLEQKHHQSGTRVWEGPLPNDQKPQIGDPVQIYGKGYRLVGASFSYQNPPSFFLVNKSDRVQPCH